MNLPGGTPRAVAVAVAALVLAGGAALLVVNDDDGEQQVATGASTSTTEEPTTTTALVVTTTTLVPTTVPPTVATAPPATTATTRPTTTTNAPARTFTLTPTSGPGYQEIKAAGGGCTGPDAGVGLTVYAPSGKGLTGSGAAAMPDGTWEVPLSVPPDEGPGRYKIVAACTNGNRTVFTYAPNYYTVTG